MKTNRILQKENQIIIKPNRYSLILLIFSLLLFITTPLVILIFLGTFAENPNIYESFKMILKNKLDIIILFYILFIIIIRTLIKIRKKIPLEIVLNNNQIKILTSNKSEFVFPLNLWQFYYIEIEKYRVRSQTYVRNSIILLNLDKNIKFKLYEGKENEILVISDFLKINTQLKKRETFKSSDFINANYKNIDWDKNQKDPISSEKNKELTIISKNKKFRIDLCLILLFFILIFIRFLIHFEENMIDFDKIINLNLIEIFNYFFVSFILILFILFLIYSLIDSFFDLYIKRNHHNLLIYKRLSIIPKISILVKKFDINDHLTLNLELYYDTKFSFIKIYDYEYQKKNIIKFLMFHFYKITLVNYTLDECYRIYQNLTLILK